MWYRVTIGVYANTLKINYRSLLREYIYSSSMYKNSDRFVVIKNLRKEYIEAVRCKIDRRKYEYYVYTTNERFKDVTTSKQYERLPNDLIELLSEHYRGIHNFEEGEKEMSETNSSEQNNIANQLLDMFGGMEKVKALVGVHGSVEAMVANEAKKMQSKDAITNQKIRKKIRTSVEESIKEFGISGWQYLETVKSIVEPSDNEKLAMRVLFPYGFKLCLIRDTTAVCSVWTTRGTKSVIPEPVRVGIKDVVKNFNKESLIEMSKTLIKLENYKIVPIEYGDLAKSVRDKIKDEDIRTPWECTAKLSEPEVEKFMGEFESVAGRSDKILLKRVAESRQGDIVTTIEKKPVNNPFAGVPNQS